MTSDRDESGNIVVGQPVVSADGHQLGEVKELRGPFFKVDASMAPDYWLPLDIARPASGMVALTVAKDRVDEYKRDDHDELSWDDDADERGGSVLI